MMIDVKPGSKEVEWRPPDAEDALDGTKDPVEAILKDYDFKALHDRIMLALEVKTQTPMKGKSKLQ